jgi:hypothetical protein
MPVKVVVGRAALFWKRSVCESLHYAEAGTSCRSKRPGPSEAKTQAIPALLQGKTAAEHGEALWSTLVSLTTYRVLPRGFRPRTEGLDCQRSARHSACPGSRYGYADEPLQTAEGVLRSKGLLA